MERVPLDVVYDTLAVRPTKEGRGQKNRDPPPPPSALCAPPSAFLLPPLLRLERLDVPLPAFIIRVLEWAAREQGRTLANYLRWELFDIVESLLRLNVRIERDIPGVAAAL